MANPQIPGFEIVTSMRYDASLSAGIGTLYMPELHRLRLLDSASQLEPEAFKLQDVHWLASCTSFSAFVSEHVHMWLECRPEHARPPLKIRLAVNALSIPAFTITAVSPTPIELLHPRSFEQLLERNSTSSHLDCPHWNIWIDTEHTTIFPNNTIKSNQRQAYDNARKRVGLVDYALLADVLLVNEAGNIMETSISTVYVEKGGRWITPTLRSGCQAGTTRRWALAMGYCIEEDVQASDVSDAICIISNGVRGFAVGRIKKQNAVTDSRNVVD